MVDLWIHGHGKVNSLPLENMPAWQYLSEVIVPGSLGLLCIENASVNASIGYYVMGGIKMFEFNYENRLTAMEVSEPLFQTIPNTTIMFYFRPKYSLT